jgi:mannan endo-1,4-beta-mannosidase
MSMQVPWPILSAIKNSGILLSSLIFCSCGHEAKSLSGLQSQTLLFTSGDTPARAFHVKGRHLYDRCGEKVILRGINEMVVYSPGSDGTAAFKEIAKTGANTVRIVWTVAARNHAGLDRAISGALNAGLIPMPELHDAMGKIDRLGTLVDYWTSKEVLPIIKKYEDRILVNVGNEVGDDRVSKEKWESAWTDAIRRMRAASIVAPLVIDAPRWGQDIDRLQESGPRLMQIDPLHNLLFSVHTWWADGNAEKIAAELEESVNMNLPLIVGEFGPYAVYQCPQYPFDYRALLAQAQATEIGWLAWSWGYVRNRDCPGLFDMTRDGSFETLQGWGLDVALSDPHSIRNTSVRPQSMLKGSCE